MIEVIQEGQKNKHCRCAAKRESFAMKRGGAVNLLTSVNIAQ